MRKAESIVAVIDAHNFQMQESIYIIELRSVHTTPQLRYVAALQTHMMLLHCGVTRNLNSH